MAGATARGGAIDQAIRSFPGGELAASTNGRSGGGGAPGSSDPPLQISSQRAESSTVRLTLPTTTRPFQPSRSGASEIRPR